MGTDRSLKKEEVEGYRACKAKVRKETSMISQSILVETRNAITCWEI